MSFWKPPSMPDSPNLIISDALVGVPSDSTRSQYLKCLFKDYDSLSDSRPLFKLSTNDVEMKEPLESVKPTHVNDVLESSSLLCQYNWDSTLIRNVCSAQGHSIQLSTYLCKLFSDISPDQAYIYLGVKL